MSALPVVAVGSLAVGDRVRVTWSEGATHDGSVVDTRSELASNRGSGTLSYAQVEYDDGDRAWVDESWEVRRIGPPAEAPAAAAAAEGGGTGGGGGGGGGGAGGGGDGGRCERSTPPSAAPPS